MVSGADDDDVIEMDADVEFVLDVARRIPCPCIRLIPFSADVCEVMWMRLIFGSECL